MTKILVEYSALNAICFIENRQPTYSELLSTKEWFSRRESILARDKRCCSHCGTTETDNLSDTNRKWHNVFLWEADYSKVSDFDVEAYGKNLFLGKYTIKIADKAYWLHVHHKHYCLDKLPWQYEDDDLITLCNWCHYNWHLSNVAPVFKLDNGTYKEIGLEVCGRCRGAGILPEYKHNMGGICFRCKGRKYIGLESEEHL